MGQSFVFILLFFIADLVAFHGWLQGMSFIWQSLGLHRELIRWHLQMVGQTESFLMEGELFLIEGELSFLEGRLNSGVRTL